MTTLPTADNEKRAWFLKVYSTVMVRQGHQRWKKWHRRQSGWFEWSRLEGPAVITATKSIKL